MSKIELDRRIAEANPDDLLLSIAFEIKEELEKQLKGICSIHVEMTTQIPARAHCIVGRSKGLETFQLVVSGDGFNLTYPTSYRTDSKGNLLADQLRFGVDKRMLILDRSFEEPDVVEEVIRTAASVARLGAGNAKMLAR